MKKLQTMEKRECPLKHPSNGCDVKGFKSVASVPEGADFELTATDSDFQGSTIVDVRDAPAAAPSESGSKLSKAIGAAIGAAAKEFVDG